MSYNIRHRASKVVRMTTTERTTAAWNGGTGGLIPEGTLVHDTDLDDLFLGDGTPAGAPTAGTSGGILIGPSAGGSPGGSDTQVQFNDASTFGGDAGLTYNKTDDQLSADNINVLEVLNLSNDINPTLSGGTTHNWNPAGLATASVIRITTSTADTTLSGMVAPVSPLNDGRLLFVINDGGGFVVNFLHENAGSTDVNRFSFDGNFRLAAGQGCVLMYDLVKTRWRCYGLMGPVVHTHQSSVTGGSLDAGLALSSGQVALARGGSNADLSGGTINSQLLRMNAGGTAYEGSGKTAPTGDIVGTTDSQTLSGKTLTTPTIVATGFTNMNHTHQAANTGGTLTTAAIASGTFAENRGGTNQSTYAQGDLLYASAANTLAKLAKGTARQVLRMNSGATVPEWRSTANSKGGTIINPTSALDASRVSLFFTPIAITVSATRAHITGATNVIFNIGHATTANGTQNDVFTADITLTSVSGQTNNSGFNDATIPANSYVWIEIVSVSGTPSRFHCTVEYTID